MTARFLLLLVCLACWGTAHAAQDLKVIYQEKSLYRNILVREGNGLRCMTFGRYHGEQSCIELANPDRLVFTYTRGLFTAFYAVKDVRRVLVIGLGGGVIPRAVRSAFPQADVDSVELDPAVARVAVSHFGFAADTHSRVFVDDGRVFVRKQRRAGVQYDIVMIDAFEKESIPEHMLTREFLSEVKNILAPGGIVASNTLADGVLRDHEAATYQAVYGSIHEVSMSSGNRIILAARDKFPALSEMTARGRALDPQLRSSGVVSADLLPMLRLQQQLPGVRLLTDQYAPSNLLLRRRR